MQGAIHQATVPLPTGIAKDRVLQQVMFALDSKRNLLHIDADDGLGAYAAQCMTAK